MLAEACSSAPRLERFLETPLPSVLLLQVWVGHSCPMPLTLLLILVLLLVLRLQPYKSFARKNL